MTGAGDADAFFWLGSQQFVLGREKTAVLAPIVADADKPGRDSGERMVSFTVAVETDSNAWFLAPSASDNAALVGKGELSFQAGQGIRDLASNRELKVG